MGLKDYSFVERMPARRLRTEWYLASRLIQNEAPSHDSMLDGALLHKHHTRLLKYLHDQGLWDHKTVLEESLIGYRPGHARSVEFYNKLRDGLTKKDMELNDPSDLLCELFDALWQDCCKEISHDVYRPDDHLGDDLLNQVLTEFERTLNDEIPSTEPEARRCKRHFRSYVKRYHEKQREKKSKLLLKAWNEALISALHDTHELEEISVALMLLSTAAPQWPRAQIGAIVSRYLGGYTMPEAIREPRQTAQELSLVALLTGGSATFELDIGPESTNVFLSRCCRHVLACLEIVKPLLMHGVTILPKEELRYRGWTDRMEIKYWPTENENERINMLALLDECAKSFKNNHFPHESHHAPHPHMSLIKRIIHHLLAPSDSCHSYDVSQRPTHKRSSLLT